MSGDKWKPLFGDPVAPWHKWFAWHPVDTIDYGWVWLRKVNRRRCQIKTFLPGGGVRWWQHVMETE